MAIYFLSSGFEDEMASALQQTIRQAIPDLIEIRDIQDVARRATTKSNEGNFVLLVAPSNESGDFADLIKAASGKREDIFFVLISEDISASDYKRLVRTGGADWVAISAVPQDIVDIVRRRRSGNEEASVGRAPVVASFVPSAGGVGNTTLAVEVASHLKANKATAQRNVCIVDLDFQTSHVCDYLDLEPRLQIQEVSTNPERLDDQLFDIFISRHSSGLHVFSAPRAKFDYYDLNISALDMLFNMMSTRYDFIIIDLPVCWFSWTFEIIARSDGVVVTGINTIPGLRQFSETVAAVRGVRGSPGQMAVAVNRCERRLLGGIARRRHVEEVLGRDNVFYVRDDPMVLQSANMGVPMAVAKSSRQANSDIAAIGAFCAGMKPLRVPSIDLGMR